ncbi:MAG: 50S ribosome-binding GTPase [Pirellulaceae bacterium]|nr:50S ribosome-binding GTPase [Pirellulaceae bacterium]
MNCFVSLGASPAERGEFALRSFLAGKMDLVQAEAVLGVIQSVDRDQLQWSLSQLGGNLSQPVHVLRAELLELISRLEAGLDFVEEDIQFITPQEIHERLTRVLEQIEQLRSRLQSRGTPQRQLEVALVGLPNAGKSSLFNALLERERAIVSNQAGTTRDVISAPLGLDDITLTLVDTAGLEPDLPASQPAEASPRLLAQSHTRQRLQTCDIALLCVDSSHPPTTAWIIQQRQQLEADQLRVLTVGTKADLLGGRQPHLPVDIAVSAYAPESIQALRECLQSLASAGSQHQFTQATLHTAIRCTEALQHARQSLQHAQWLNQSVAGDELVASELRVALDDLAAMIGQVHSDDILGEVFSRFCIGK